MIDKPSDMFDVHLNMIINGETVNETVETFSTTAEQAAIAAAQ